MTAPHTRHFMKLRREQSGLPWGTQKFLSVLEGVEGGFAISAGIVAGLSFASISDRRILLITAGVSILVNGFNASAIKYAAEHYEDELDGHEKKHAFRSYFVPAAIEFAVYFAVCALTLLPLLFFTHHVEAVIWCTSLTLAVLYLAGLWKGYLLRKHPVRDGLELASLGLLIIIVGGLSGFILSR